MEIKLKVKERNGETISTLYVKEMYCPTQLASKWVRAKVKDKPKIKDCLLLKNTYTVDDADDGTGWMLKNGLGFMHNNANNVEHNAERVGIYTTGIHAGNAGLAFDDSNFFEVIALFTARKSIMPNWINCKDEYMVPNTAHAEYAQWNNDAIIYALFNSSSNQSSLRNIDYKGKKWNILNHFFFMSNKEIYDLANNTIGGEDIRKDTKDEKFNADRYVYTLLKSTNLSSDAKEILEMAKELIRKSFSMRVTYHGEHPEYHLNTWDAGWAQLKPMLKEYFKSDYDAFVEKYKAFENRMRQGVYKFGFLRE